uniref:Sushi, von Willebrand factor type A, EGF and pentraxin domain-containing protein 1 n=1 Tax=Syphacia muris TaxID=451379 RepID=A0A0N5AH20_9BILA
MDRWMDGWIEGCVEGVKLVDLQSSLLCPNGQVPESLTSASVWQKAVNLSIFRIGGDSLSNEGYVRSEYDRSLFVVLLSRGNSRNCPSTACALRLSTNQNSNDGGILHQENVFGVPFGYTEIGDPEGYYCVRVEGDCGADVPIYRFANYSAPYPRYAYSLDSNATIPYFIREPTPLCYGWSDGGSQKVANSLKVTGCKKLPVPENGKVNYQPNNTDEYAMGSSATLICNPGFVSTGATELICSYTGWYPSETFELCQPDFTVHLSELRCQPLSSPLHGNVEYSKNGTDTYPIGTIARIKCVNGYAPENLMLQSECQVNGNWTVENLGRCKEVCQALANVSNGQLNYTTEEIGQNQYIDGTVASLQCNKGYEVNGQQSVTCETANWKPFPGIGTCIPDSNRCPFGLPLVLGGNIAYSQPDTVFGPFIVGTEAVLTCSPGLQMQGIDRSVCNNSAWNPPVLGVCIATAPTVPSPTPVTTTTVIVESTTEKILMEHSENETNRMHGVGIVEAVTPVQISELPADITRGRCNTEIPNPIDDGSGSPYAAGTIATLKCKNGYSAHGETSICHDGQWYPPAFNPCTKDTAPTGAAADEPPKCIVGVASPLNGKVRYSNGQTTGPFPFGTVAIITCNAGYIAIGTTILTCQNNEWSSGTAAQCLLENGISLGTGGFTVGSCISGLGTPLNGRIEYSNLMTVGPFPTGTAGTLICNVGYEPSGVTTSICQNGMWSPSTMGECVASATGGLGPASVGSNSCAAGLVAPLNGVISYSSGIFPPYPAGTVATVMCNLGYTVSGTPTSTCTNGAWYPSITAQCVSAGGEGGSGGVGQCPAIAGPLNGEIVYFPASSTATYSSGTTATLTCNLGYIGSGQITTTCMNGIWEPTFTGTCVLGLGGSGSTTTTQCLFALAPVLNGNVQYSTGSVVGPYNEGTSATLTCSAGYLPSGATTSICTNGAWNPASLGVCTYSG